MKGVTRNATFDSMFFPQNSVFVWNFVGFLALRADVNICQTWIQNSVFSHNCRQTATWSEVTPSGTAPWQRKGHTAVWSEAADGMYIFGGIASSGPVLGAAAVESPSTQRRPELCWGFRNDLHFFNRQASERAEVGASEQFLFPSRILQLPSWLVFFVDLFGMPLRNLGNMVLCSYNLGFRSECILDRAVGLMLSLLYSTLLYPTLLDSTLLYSTLLYFTLLYSTLLYSTLLYSILTLLYSTLLYSTLLFSTLHYSTRLYSTLLYSTLLFATPLYSTLRYSTLLYFTLLYSNFALLYFTLLYFTLPYSTLLQLYSTLTLLYFTLLYCTLLYSTQLYFTLLTLLYFTLLCDLLRTSEVSQLNFLCL